MTAAIVTAAQIINEIKALPPQEQASVVRAVYELDAERKLRGPELATLAKRLGQTGDPVEGSRVQASIVRGFSGTEHDA